MATVDTSIHANGVSNDQTSRTPTAPTTTQGHGVASNTGHSKGEVAGADDPAPAEIPADEAATNHRATASHEVEVKCGPLLNYKRMSNPNDASPTWHGSVLIVTGPGDTCPNLSLKPKGAAGGASAANGANGASAAEGQQSRSFRGEKLYQDPRVAFWRFVIDLPLQSFEATWEYYIPDLRHTDGGNSRNGAFTKQFVVPSASESMRIMFHSCNGFSVGTDMDVWTGCNLWNDALRQHEQKPIHVMIGGGDQIYNDGIRITGPLRPWTDITNPTKRRDFPFDEKMRSACDDWYLNNYIQWYGTDPFCKANGIIPQINVWDDHDIIDGFGSYTDHFMKCPVFRGIGGVAFKYYCLFQHHVPPSRSTFTTDNKSTMDGTTPNIDPVQLKDAFIAKETPEDPCYVFGKRVGPYVEERSRSVLTQLGANIYMMGIDARTERTRHQINYPDTYELLFSEASKRLTEAGGRIKHFVLLLGVPIAYPRLQWLENILQSPIIGPVRFLSKRFGVGGSLFNNFDGNVDLLDDLDDHYTAHQHKKERRELIERIQGLSKKHNVRVTILGGDVHLAALGRFYSNPKLNVPVVNDHRYMVNIVSSAITNKPPPSAVANLLASRNKIHHLDHDTDETLLNLFDKDPGHVVTDVAKKSAETNHCTMPSRNYALITASHDQAGEAPEPNGVDGSRDWSTGKLAHHNEFTGKGKGNPRDPMHAGEKDCGVDHPAASGLNKTGRGGRYGLDVAFRVEIDSKDREGKTLGYGLTIPTLEAHTTEKQAVAEV